MGRHAAGRPREQPPWERPTRPQPVLRVRKRKTSWVKKTLRVIVVLLVILIIMSVIGNFLPEQKVNKGAPFNVPNPARMVNTADILRNNSPNWYVTPHIAAVVRPEDGGKSVTLVNTGKGWTSGIITLPELGISATSVTVWNVWTGTKTPPTVRALRVVIPPGAAMFLILK